MLYKHITCMVLEISHAVVYAETSLLRMGKPVLDELASVAPENVVQLGGVEGVTEQVKISNRERALGAGRGLVPERGISLKTQVRQTAFATREAQPWQVRSQVQSWPSTRSSDAPLTIQRSRR